MKSLVIAEKPSVARDIARVLRCNQKGNGTLEGKEYVVQDGDVINWVYTCNLGKDVGDNSMY